MKKEKKPLFETMEFDNAAYAQSVIDASEMRLKRNMIAIIISVCAMLFMYLGDFFINSTSDAKVMFIIFICAVVVSYIVDDGINTLLMVIKFILRLTAIGASFLVILGSIFGFSLAVSIIVYAPVIFVVYTRIQVTKNKKAAEEYLSFCRSTSESDE